MPATGGNDWPTSRLRKIGPIGITAHRRPRWRRSYVVLAAALVGLGVVTLSMTTPATRLARAKDALAERGLKVSVKYRSTDRYPAGTVVSQSRRTGAGVLPDSRITLGIAKSPPPPPTTAPPPPPTTPERNCDPSYLDVCLDPNAEDYDCAGGSGNGPRYVEGPIRVRPPDPFELDREGDGWGCEAG
jgi:hypothetical protein